jgi:hypothetical protein
MTKAPPGQLPVRGLLVPGYSEDVNDAPRRTTGRGTTLARGATGRGNEEAGGRGLIVTVMRGSRM